MQNYGMTKHRHLFTNRQLVALTTFCDLVGEARDKVLDDSDGDKAYADAVATYLGLSSSRSADYWATLTTWEPGGEFVGHVFTKQTLSMVWDYPEANPLSDSSGNWPGAVDWAARVCDRLNFNGGVAGFADQKDAQSVRKERIDFMFSTDPPYYDNVPYADLSDCFYVWMRRALAPFYRELFATLLVPKTEELVAEPFRHGGKEEARLFFERGIARVFERIHEASDARFPTTIYYAFKQAEDDGEDRDEETLGNALRTSTGWETFLQGLANTRWQINGTWPMRTERGARTRSLGSNALASSIVLVCRPRSIAAGVVARRDFLSALKRELPVALRHLQKGSIAPVDLAQAAIGPGMSVFSRYVRVLETDGSPMSVRTALALINQTLDEVLAEQEGEFDADTRWALAWFDQQGFLEGPYGTAETLSTAKNTSVSGMVEAGIVTAKSGKVRLLKKEELPKDWDRLTDKRLTIWETTHQLLRRLEQGEAAAAELVRKLGGLGEVARDLSYRLYTICERRKWAQDALAYNALVISWPEISRLAREENKQREEELPL